MKDRREEPPAQAVETVRRRILAELEEGPLSGLDISGRVGIPEKEVYDHLQHIRTTLHRSGRKLVIGPAECANCGFVFEKRARLTKPGKCPVCRKGPVHAPLFSVGP
jgi:predicted Zn-ribbon and HTH transcriptional regulator